MAKKTRERLFHRGGVVVHEEFVNPENKGSFDNIRARFENDNVEPKEEEKPKESNVARLRKIFETNKSDVIRPTVGHRGYGGKKRKSVKKRKMAKKKSLKKRKLSKKRKSLKKRR